MRTEVIRDTRLLDALEYIDDAYIASAARYKMKYAPVSADEPKMTWRTPLKHIKIYIALAASLLLLAMASPLVSFLTYVVSNFTAGAGSGTTEEMSEDIVTDENGIPYTYPTFVEDLEPLTTQEMIMINEAYIQYTYEEMYEFYYAYYQKTNSIIDVERAAHDAAVKETELLRKHTFFNEEYYLSHKYYGVFNDCVVLVIESNLTMESEHRIADHVFGYGNSASMFAYNNGKMYDLKDAYEMGLLSGSDIGNVYTRYTKYKEFEKEWIYSIKH